MSFTDLNWIAIIVAVLSTFVVGSLWYSKLLFGNVWMKEANMDMKKIKNSNMRITYGLTFIINFITASFLAIIFNLLQTGASGGLKLGLIFAIGFTIPGIVVSALFEGKSRKYICISLGYWLVNLMLMGVIIGAWK